MHTKGNLQIKDYSIIFCIAAVSGVLEAIYPTQGLAYPLFNEFVAALIDLRTSYYRTFVLNLFRFLQSALVYYGNK